MRGEGERRERYQPASSESAAERMSGVWTHGLGGCSMMEPIFALLLFPIDQLTILLSRLQVNEK